VQQRFSFAPAYVHINAVPQDNSEAFRVSTAVEELRMVAMRSVVGKAQRAGEDSEPPRVARVPINFLYTHSDNLNAAAARRSPKQFRDYVFTGI